MYIQLRARLSVQMLLPLLLPPPSLLMSTISPSFPSSFLLPSTTTVASKYQRCRQVDTIQFSIKNVCVDRFVCRFFNMIWQSLLVIFHRPVPCRDDGDGDFVFSRVRDNVLGFLPRVGARSLSLEIIWFLNYLYKD